MAPITTSTVATSAVLDLTLINELYEVIQQNPTSTEARRVLMHQFIQVGWLESAGTMARELLEINPMDREALECSQGSESVEKRPSCGASTTAPRSNKTAPSNIYDIELAKQDMAQGYQRLLIRAKKLQQELRLLQNIRLEDGRPFRYENLNVDIEALASGRISAVARLQKPGSARSVARAMENRPKDAMDIAINDLVGMARWLRSEATAPSSNKTIGEPHATQGLSLVSALPSWTTWRVGSEPGVNPAPTPAPAINNDDLRDAIIRRVGALKAALPTSLRQHASMALMHVEHEVLERKYVNDETMLGDPVGQIPRQNFFVSEDGYCWCMDELSQALTCGDGIMRNPLSRQMFTTDDVRAIIQHPLGKSLAALHVEQNKLSKGVRLKTIDRMDDLAKILLADMSSDAMASRQAVDEFLSYMVTLPEAEQKALDQLRVPAKDRHTNQSFDTTIGASVRDAKANLTCFHKTGDFISQAAVHLRKL